MCDDVSFEDGRQATNQGELRSIIGDNLVRHNEYADNAFGDGCCLCPIDLEATAIKVGYIAVKEDMKGEYDPFDTWFKKSPNPNEPEV